MKSNKFKIITIILISLCVIVTIQIVFDKNIELTLLIGGILLFLFVGLWDPPPKHGLNPEAKRVLSSDDSYEISEKIKKYGKELKKRKRK
ncbi:hypothetical protein [Desulfosediminicola flagellatus]|uniref:hypothetical protein n=1 Tax=Desulfosediminicola flagellatus TaxID=2569541 RepID=UPI0010AD5154|nr:hypothetical protein [Desulfosediminicola flagellatus]